MPCEDFRRPLTSYINGYVFLFVLNSIVLLNNFRKNLDPGNYSTGVAAGAGYQFGLLFIARLSNITAIFLQSLCIKLGTVSGMNLAQISRAHFPRCLNWFLYVMAEGLIARLTGRI